MDPLVIVNFVLLALLMVGLGGSIEYSEFKRNFTQPKGILIGLLSQFIVMPAVAFGLAEWLLNGQPVLQVALVLMGCSPGGALSNLLSWLFGTDLALSIAMTTASSILAIGMLPLNIYLYINLTGLGSEIKIDYKDLVISVIVIIGGTLSGIFIRYKSAKWAHRFGVLGGLAGIVLVILGFVYNSTSDTPLWAQDADTYLAAFLTSFIGLLVGFSLALLLRLKKPSCVAISIETSVQNKVIALAIISLSFANQKDINKANNIPLLYGLFATVMNFVWGAVAWKIGFTNYDRKLTVCELITNAKKTDKDDDCVDTPPISGDVDTDTSADNQTEEIDLNDIDLDKLETGKQ